MNGFTADCPVLLLDFSVTGGMGSNQEPGGHRDYSGSSREKSRGDGKGTSMRRQHSGYAHEISLFNSGSVGSCHQAVC